MAKAKPLTYECFMTIDGKAVPVKSLPPEEWEKHKKKMLDNISRDMSDYYSGKLR